MTDIFPAIEMSMRTALRPNCGYGNVRCLLIILLAVLACPAKVHSLTVQKYTSAISVFFSGNSSDLSDSESFRLRDWACLGMLNQLEVVVAIGHASKQERNPIPLARARAFRTTQFLMSLGIQSGTVFFEGKGASQPIDDDVHPERRSLNQRVELELAGGPLPDGFYNAARDCDRIGSALVRRDDGFLRNFLFLYKNSTHAARVFSPYGLAMTRSDIAIRRDTLNNPAVALLQIGRFDLASLLWNQGLPFDRKSPGAEVAVLACANEGADADIAKRLSKLLGRGRPIHGASMFRVAKACAIEKSRFETAKVISRFPSVAQ